MRMGQSPAQASKTNQRYDCKVWNRFNFDSENYIIDFFFASEQKSKTTSAECPHCDFKCDSRRKLGNHMREHSDFECEICHKKFTTRNTLVQHSVKHMNDFVCYLCNVQFRNMVSCRDHINNVHMKDLDAVLKYSCSNCNDFSSNSKLVYGRHYVQCCAGGCICHRCLDVFPNAEKRRVHIETNHTPKLQCIECGKSFFNQWKLSNHMKRHKGNETYRTAIATDGRLIAEEEYKNSGGSGQTNGKNASYECYLCHIPRSSHGACLEHMKNVHVKDHKAKEPDYKYKCPNCKKFESTTRVDLVKHYKKCCIGGCTCYICKCLLPSREARRQHINEHHERKYQCEECGFLTWNQWKLNRHIKHHGERNRYQCDQCAKFFKDLRTLEEHLVTHTGSAFKCAICNKAYNSNEKLHNHQATVHTVWTTLNAKPMNNVCFVCKKYYTSASNLRQHMKRHDVQKLKRCHVCNYGVPTSSELRTHMKTHTNKREFQCDLCSKSFKMNKYLLNHKQIIHGSQGEEVTCKICNKKLKSRFLDMHMRRHRGEDLIKCPYCDKKSVTSSEHNSHLRTHSEQRDFQCDMCPRAFKRQFQLSVHRRIHLGIFKFQCCGKGFHDSRIYKKHIQANHWRGRFFYHFYIIFKFFIQHFLAYQCIPKIWLRNIFEISFTPHI